MDELSQIISKVISKEFSEELNSLSDGDAEQFIDNVTRNILTDVEAGTLDAVRRLAPRNLRFAIRRNHDFAKRVRRRWKKPLDELELIWAISEEQGRLLNEALRPGAAEAQDYKFDALSRLHARSLLVAREIICLLESGYPDGALARWRSLHEHAVIAQFIGQSDADTAMRYLASFHFQSRKNAKQYNRYAQRANLKPFTDEEINQFDAICEGLKPLTRELEKDYGWAAAALGKRSPKLLDLEEATGLDHWRPRYKWACQHTHAPHRPGTSMLGAAESEQEVLLVGASNSGFVDPIQMTAISMGVVTTQLLLHEETLDNIVWLRVLNQLIEPLGELALETERRTRDSWLNEQRRWRWLPQKLLQVFDRVF